MFVRLEARLSFNEYQVSNNDERHQQSTSLVPSYINICIMPFVISIGAKLSRGEGDAVGEILSGQSSSGKRVSSSSQTNEVGKEDKASYVDEIDESQIVYPAS